MTSYGHLDDALDALGRYGPEFDGYLSSHGPMVVEVLERYGFGSRIDRWLSSYVRRLEEAPRPQGTIDKARWHDFLGEIGRVGDWVGFFGAELREAPFADVLATWWPRLVSGSVAAATHCVIRIGHVVTALRQEETQPRLDEIARALGYFAARWQEVPFARPASGTTPADVALGNLPRLSGAEGGIRNRLPKLESLNRWPESLEALYAPEAPSQVPGALEDLIAAAVSSYLRFGRENPVMLVHAATAPNAIASVLPVLPSDLWQASYNAAWLMTAAVTSSYASGEPDESDVVEPASSSEAMERALDNGDEHLIKFADTGILADLRGHPEALAAIGRSQSLLD